MRSLFDRYGEAGVPGWTAPSRDELSEHCTEHLLLCLVAEGAVVLDAPVNGHLRSLRLADDAVTVREMLSHTAQGAIGYALLCGKIA